MFCPDKLADRKKPPANAMTFFRNIQVILFFLLIFESIQSYSYMYISYQVAYIRYVGTFPNYYHLPIHAASSLYAGRYSFEEQCQ